MASEITIKSSIDYHPKYPPAGAKKAYVAKITGRAPGAVKFAREFLGDEVTLVEGDAGLYERQDGDKKGGATRYYHVVVSHPEHGLIISADCEDELPKIAKLLDEGVSIQDAVEVLNVRPSERYEGRTIFDAKARTKQQAKVAGVSAAVDACLVVLDGLSQPEKQKALAEIRRRLAAAQHSGATPAETIST